MRGSWHNSGHSDFSEEENSLSKQMRALNQRNRHRSLNEKVDRAFQRVPLEGGDLCCCQDHSGTTPSPGGGCIRGAHNPAQYVKLNLLAQYTQFLEEKVRQLSLATDTTIICTEHSAATGIINSFPSSRLLEVPLLPGCLEQHPPVAPSWPLPPPAPVSDGMEEDLLAAIPDSQLFRPAFTQLTLCSQDDSLFSPDDTFSDIPSLDLALGCQQHHTISLPPIMSHEVPEQFKKQFLTPKKPPAAPKKYKRKAKPRKAATVPNSNPPARKCLFGRPRSPTCSDLGYSSEESVTPLPEEDFQEVGDLLKNLDGK